MTERFISILFPLLFVYGPSNQYTLSEDFSSLGSLYSTSTHLVPSEYI